MHTPRRIYVAAANKDVGKTTATLGIIAALQEQDLKVGYCKPLGQKYIEVEGVKVDKDAPLFTQYLNTPLIPEWHSPVILGPGVASRYINHPEDFDFPTKVREAAHQLGKRNSVVVYEGTGHPGVGSVVDMCNARVAQMLNAGVILVVEAGIGRTLDQITLNKAIFAEKNVPILGVIVNKVRREKLDKVKSLVGKKLQQWGIPLLGVIPFEERLALPIVQAVQKAVEGKFLRFQEKSANRVEGLISVRNREANRCKTKNQLLITADNRLDRALQALRNDCHSRMPLSGIVLTGRPEISSFSERIIQENEIPLIYTEMDTYEAVIEYSRIEVKLNPKTSWKIEEAIQLFREHLSIMPILKLPIAV